MNLEKNLQATNMSITIHSQKNSKFPLYFLENIHAISFRKKCLDAVNTAGSLENIRLCGKSHKHDLLFSVRHLC